jgi:CHAD domain-containing protein
MAFEIKPDETVAKCVRRLTFSQIDKALARLEGEDASDLEEVVHDVRKRFKRVRAVIRLAADGLGRKRREREDVRFRDAGRPLSEVRDADVLVQTLESLVQLPGEPGGEEDFATAREALRGRKDATSRRTLDEEGTLVRLAVELEEAGRDVKRWDVRGGGWDVLGGGLEGIYRRGHRACYEALGAPTDEGLHAWRKRIKDLWYAMEILRPIRPAYTEHVAEKAHKLADLLGDDHDLAVLREVLAGPEGVAEAGASLDAILSRIERRRAELQRDAFVLGPSLFGERPEVFAARLRAYWRAWRAEAKASAFDGPGRRGLSSE